MRNGETILISSLSDLVAPLSPAQFGEMLAARVPTVFRAENGARFASLLDWEGLMQLVCAGDYARKSLRLTRQGAPVPRGLYMQDGKPKAEVIRKVMETGGSLVFYGIDPYVAAMARLSEALSSATGEPVVGSAIASTGTGGALPVHYDETDLIVLQVEGAKRWRIEDDPVPHPVPGLPTVPGREGARVVVDTVLEAGDLLFVPGGYRHRCETGSDRSLHLGFFFYPLTPARVVQLLAQEMIESEDDRIPIRGEGALADAEARLKRRLVERIDRLSLDEMLRMHRTAAD